MKVHRAVTLALMMLVSVAVIAGMTAQGIHEFSRGSLIALVVVVVGAAAAGIAFSWKRYFPRRG